MIQKLLTTSILCALLVFVSTNANAQVDDGEGVEMPTRIDTNVPPPPPPPPPPPAGEEIFQVVEDMPNFPGCEDIKDNEEKKKCAQQKMLEHIYANLQYPPIAVENNITGTCVVRFFVDKDGSLSDAQLLKDIGAGCGAEALRLVNSLSTSSKKWIPGKARAHPVKVYFNLPIKFSQEMLDEAKNKSLAKNDIETSPSPKKEPFQVVEEMPRFPGCEDQAMEKNERQRCAQKKMLEYVYRNLRYPPSAKDKKIEGTVIVRFAIDKEGNIIETKILKDIGEGCGEESVRIVNTMNEMPEKWIPGYTKGAPVKVYFNLPIKFRLK